MRLVAFSVRNFRSITDGYKLPLGDFAVLVGPNNEGKSNVLKAIVIALGLLSRSQYYRTQRQLRYRYAEDEELSYRWERDFPLSLQSDNPDGKSEFVLELQLSAAELLAFRTATKINLNSNLKFRLTLGREDAKFEALMQGKAKKKFTEKLVDVARFIAERLDIQYIPAIRPATLAEGAVEELVARELAQLEADPKYQELLSQLEAAQQPVLAALGAELTKTVASFIPEVASVSISSAGTLRRALRHSARVRIDDGNDTDLARKGDGVKSLTAIALLRHTSQKSQGSRSLIFAIEEPESHLHPKAVHGLRGVLQEIAVGNQVILTTHSPVLVDRHEPRRNIIVRDGRALPARKIRDVRDALGVEISDNLVSASLVLLVEGEEDVLILGAWLPKLSVRLAGALSNGTLAIDTLNGATNLRYKAGLHKAHLCAVHAFVDNDDAGRLAIESSVAAGVLEQKEYQAAVCQGMPSSELEDLLKISSYEQAVLVTFGVALEPKFMSSSKKQWSDRVRDNFQNHGKPWSKQLERQIKGVVAAAASSEALSSLNDHRRGPIDALVAQLESRMVQ